MYYLAYWIWRSGGANKTTKSRECGFVSGMLVQLTNEKRYQVKGSICGVKIEAIEDPIYKDIRILDKLIDDLAKGKSLEKLLP